MSRTDLDASTLANILRAKAGDGSVEWVYEPIQASVLLDIADMLDENAKLVGVLHEVEAEAVYAYHCLQQDCMTTADSSEHFFKKWWHAEGELDRLKAENTKLREYIEHKKVLQDYARLFDDNAKLRELCAGLLTGYECGHGDLCKGCTWDGLGDPKTFPCLPRVKARELGVEVTS